MPKINHCLNEKGISFHGREAGTDAPSGQTKLEYWPGKQEGTGNKINQRGQGNEYSVDHMNRLQVLQTHSQGQQWSRG